MINQLNPSLRVLNQLLYPYFTDICRGLSFPISNLGFQNE